MPAAMCPLRWRARSTTGCRRFTRARGSPKGSGIRTPKNLEGKRVGVMRYTMTAAVWQRGHLQNDYGVDLAKIHWVEGAINSPGSHGVPTIIPPGTSFERNASGK